MIKCSNWLDQRLQSSTFWKEWSLKLFQATSAKNGERPKTFLSLRLKVATTSEKFKLGISVKAKKFNPESETSWLKQLCCWIIANPMILSKASKGQNSNKSYLIKSSNWLQALKLWAACRTTGKKYQFQKLSVWIQSAWTSFVLQT